MTDVVIITSRWYVYIRYAAGYEQTIYVPLLIALISDESLVQDWAEDKLN